MTERFKTLLFTRRGDIDEYANILVESQIPIDLLICRTEEDLEKFIPEAEIIFGVHLPPQVYAKASRLRWIQSMWAGVEGLIRSPLPKDVLITRPIGVFGKFISHYVFGYLLAHRIKMRQGFEQQAERQWKHYKIGLLEELRLGIAGMGDIGAEIARIGKTFKMEIWGLNRTPKTHPLIDRGFGVGEINQFAAGIDALAIVLPNTPETRGFFNREVLSNLQPHVYLINVGRGAVIDDAALMEILNEGGIAGAALDVFVEEPLPPEHPYWGLPNCIVTSHVGGPSLPEDITRCFLENYRKFAAGETMAGLVDFERGY